ncbi:MAG: GNAT family N-acetyltransferase [Crocinitomicaceae bacterium]|nr:GNAT family N-acetyltransferase [Crocinitomicaceae bacterium]
MKDEIKIVRATSEDATLIAELGEKTFWESHGNSAEKKHVQNFIDNVYNPTAQRKELLDKLNEVYIIYCNNQPAGFSKIIFNSPHEIISGKINTTKFDRIYILKEFYGQGIGKALFDFNVDLAKKNQQTGLWLFVWVENKRAVRFYETCGFEKIGVHEYRLSPTHTNPNHIMYLEF